jgi:hypothetical protein
MNQGDLVRVRNSESGELGVFIGKRTFTNTKGKVYDYLCSEVYWPERKKVETVQTNLIEVFDERR